MDGILNIDKPEGMTSHDVVQWVRKRFDISKVGHLGTLDPIATGVLPIAIGKATRIAQFLPNSPKEYEGEIRFGFATNTYDREGVPLTEERSIEGDLETALRSLTGTVDQVPPPFSAKKIGGVPAYKLARRNQEVEMTPARVQIDAFDMQAFAPPFMKFRVLCSPGTYVRSLAHDLGQRLGCGAHLTVLRRVRSGNFRISDAVRLDKITEEDLVPIDRLLDPMPKIEVSGIDETRIVHGNPIRAAGHAKTACILNKQGQFIAVGSIENGWVHPRLVLTSRTSHTSDMLGCTLKKEIET